MRLAEGIIIKKEETFGVLKFSALRREVKIVDEEGNVTEQIKERRYYMRKMLIERIKPLDFTAPIPNAMHICLFVG